MRARLELDAAPLRLLGSPSLAGHYARAAAALGLATETVDADQAYLAALRAIQNAWTGP
jgi:2-keto-3-deoxy-galactonokinase